MYSNPILNALQKNGHRIDTGLDQTEITNIEKVFEIKLPTELQNLLSEGMPAGRGFTNWRDPKKALDSSTELLQGAFEFDIRESNYWTSEFGEKPSSIDEAVEVATRIIKTWPALLPIYAHRHIATNADNGELPVLSIWQAVDTIFYGYNLTDYFNQEFDLHIPTKVDNTVKIPHWEDAFDLRYTIE